MFTFCNGYRLVGLIYLPITVRTEKKSDCNLFVQFRLLIFKSSDSGSVSFTAAPRLSLDVGEAELMDPAAQQEPWGFDPESICVCVQTVFLLCFFYLNRMRRW